MNSPAAPSSTEPPLASVGVPKYSGRAMASSQVRSSLMSTPSRLPKSAECVSSSVNGSSTTAESTPPAMPPATNQVATLRGDGPSRASAATRKIA